MAQVATALELADTAQPVARPLPTPIFGTDVGAVAVQTAYDVAISKGGGYVPVLRVNGENSDRISAHATDSDSDVQLMRPGRVRPVTGDGDSGRACGQ